MVLRGHGKALISVQFTVVAPSAGVAAKEIAKGIKEGLKDEEK